jgi:hypothetical protein
LRASPILLLVLCQIVLLSFAASAEQEMLTIGKYDISFSLQARGPYQIDAVQENDTYQVIINDSSRHAVIYLSESRNIGSEETIGMVDELFRAANITNPDHYIRTIDGQRAILGVGSGYEDDRLLFTAAFPKYFGAEGTGLYVLVGSDFPWENTTRKLLDTLRVDMNRTLPGAMQTLEQGRSVGGSEYGLPFSRTDGQGAETAGNQSSDLLYDGYITFSDNSGRSIEDAVVIENALSEEDGVASEYYYLEEKFGQRDVDWFLENQELVSEEKRFYDKMDVKLADKSMITIYFDINEFFGLY